MRAKTKRRRSGGVRSAQEWIGGRYELPAPVVGEGPEYFPLVCVWVEQPEGLVVGSTVVRPNESAGSLGAALLEAIRDPMVGPPRRPRRIRVADQELAAEVEQALRGIANIPVVVAPTPEAEHVIDVMTGSMGGSGPDSYLDGGRIAAAAIGRLFDVAATLHICAPWKVVDDSQIIRLDIPALGVEAACLSIIGNGGQSFGFLIFPSLVEYESFADRGPRADATFLALSYDPPSQLSKKMVREVEEHDWHVAGPEAYPLLINMVSGSPARIGEAEVRILTACSASLAAFFVRFGKALAQEYLEPVCASFDDQDDLTVRFTAPYGADYLFEANDPAPAPPNRGVRRVGRNDPCPCGSGKKYKKCHLDADARGRDDLVQRVFVPPELTNTDGDPLLLTTDHFDFDPAERNRIEAALAGMEGVAAPERDGALVHYAFTRPGNAMHASWENTTIAFLRLGDGKMAAETSSINRADDFRRHLESACGDLIRHRLREHTDPTSSAHADSRHSTPDPETENPELQHIAREFKERHYATWPDHPLPALGGKTPRQAMRTAAGRLMVDALIKDLENLESKGPEESRFDCNILRRELGLES